MKLAREERFRHRPLSALLLGALLSVAACARPAPPPAETQSPPGNGGMGRHGGRLVVALAAEPKTLNPVSAGDLTSRAVIHRMSADLIRIDRESQESVPELVERWAVSEDGRHYTLKMRPELRFSDGHPADIDDVIFSFRVYLDETIASPGRDLLLVGGMPPAIRKVDSHTVEIDLPEPYAAAERLFDGFAILPRHLLEESYQAGRLVETWGLATPAEDIAGLGPFRLKEYRPGERLVLERNPHYWKKDTAGQQLPYLDEIVFLFTPTQEAQTLRFLAGELDVIDRLSPSDFTSLAREAQARDFQLFDLGPGLDYNFLLFNLNHLDRNQELPEIARKQRWFRQVPFRQAVLAAIDLQGIVQLVYQGRATPLASHETPGNKVWGNSALKPPTRSLVQARSLLEDSGFHWDADGRLIDSEGQRVEISILTATSSPQRTRIATLIQSDLKQIGIEVRLTSLELGAVSDRLMSSHDYEACILGLGGGSASPNRMMNVLLSSGVLHLWHLGQNQPATPWEAEIDDLMRRQLVSLDPEERKRLYDRVQHIVAEKLPLISLVSPNVLVGAKNGLGNFRPTILSHHTLWNAEELFWQGKSQ